MDSPRFAWFAAALGCLLSGRSLGAGLVLDDLIHRLSIAGKATGFQRGPLSLYEFLGAHPRDVAGLIDAGYVPWWASADLKIRLFRPLPSALIWLESELFGARVWLCHLHSLLWFAALVLVVGRFLRSVLPARSAAWAVLIFAIAGYHIEPVAWLSARYALMTALLGTLCLHAHVRFRRDHWLVGRWYSLAALAVSLFCAESGCAVFGFLIAFEALAATDSIGARLRALLPPLALGAAYLTLYGAFGYGASNSALYLSPLESPRAYLSALVWRVPALIAESFLTLPAEASSVSLEGARLMLVLCGVSIVLIALAHFATRARIDAHEQRAVRWLALGALIALLPGAAGSIGGRVLTLPALGVAALVGSLTSAAFQKAPRRWLRILAVAGLALPAFLLAPAARVLRTEDLIVAGSETKRLASNSDLDRCPKDAGVVLIADSDPISVTYVPVARALFGGHSEQLRGANVLSMAPHAHVLDQVTRDGFDLRVLGQPRAASFWERLMRSAAWHAGEEVRLPLFAMSVLEATAAGPTHLRVRFNQPLNSPHLCLFTTLAGKLSPFVPPAAGEQRTLPNQPGALGL